jgi:imidazolonepropionase-like amidohydrolase
MPSTISSSLVAIRHARIVDGRGGLIEKGTVLIKGDRITAVGSDRELSVPRKASVVDARGMTLLPGLIDCHVHLCLGGDADVIATVRSETSAFTLLKAARFADETLSAGFTTVRDLGARDHGILALKQALAARLTRGPRILAAGSVICMTGGHAAFSGRQADGPVEIVQAVREQVAAGADVIKFIASGGVLTPGTSPDRAQLTLEELSAGIAEARLAGRRVAAHAHGAEGIKNAVRAGTHSIEHATLLDDEAGALMRSQGVFMVPTLSALATTASCGPACGVPESAVTKARNMKGRHEASFKKALRSGIPIAMGTDAGTPFNHHGENAQELTRMVALGMSPMEAIQSATASAADLLGIQELVGTVEPGKMADLLLVEGNPLKRIELLQDRGRLAGVMQAGRFVSGPLRDAG